MEEVKQHPEFLPELATLVALWFPSLKGRAVAVTEIEVTKENRPTLPLAVLALHREEAQHNQKGNKDPDLTDDFIVEFWLPLIRYKDTKSGAESPFWAYYPFEAIRDRLLTKMLEASRNHQNWGIRYISMDVAADADAVILTFRFSRNYTWCPDDDETDTGDPIEVTLSLCQYSEPAPLTAD